MEQKLKVLDTAFFKSIQDRYIEIAGAVTFKNEACYALQLLHSNQYLAKVAKSNQESLLKAVLNTATTGLTLNPLEKLAYLVPMGKDVVLMPSYIGMVKLLTDTGSVKSVYAHVVYDGDDFDVSLGTDTEVVHRPKFQSKEIKLAYAVGVLHNGQKMVEVMSIADLDDVCDMSESYKAWVKRNKTGTCIWVDHKPEMCRKTVIKRLTKSLPRTDKWKQMSQVIDLDNIEYKMTEDQRYLIDTMLESTNLPEEVEDRILMQLGSATAKDASSIIDQIRQYQRDDYSQGSIGKRVDLAVERDNT